MAGLCDEDLVELSLDDIKNSCGFGLDIGNYEIVSNKKVVEVGPWHISLSTNSNVFHENKRKMEHSEFVYLT